MAHTPGPWLADLHATAVSGGRTYAYVRANSIVPIACIPLGVEGYGRQEGEANARLIAAAPDLLDALKGMVGLVQLVRGRDDCPAEIVRVLADHYRLDDALAAIAKAEDPR